MTLRRDTSANRPTPRVWPLIPALLFLLSLALNLHHVPTTEFHPDETRWINRAHYFPDLLDPFGPTWEDQYLTRGQPPLGSYLMGLGLLLQGRDTDTNGVWDFAYGPEWNRISGAMTEHADLTAARRTNAVIAALTVVVVFFIGSALAGTIAGTAGGLLLAIHPLHIWIGSQALSDQLLILIIALTVLTALRLGRRPSRGKALLLGILLGLGGAVKLSPLLLSIPVALYGAALLLLAKRGLVDGAKTRRLAPLLVVQPAIAGITFVASYPYLWPAPIERTINLFELRTQEMEGQASAWPQVAIEHPGEGLLRVYDRLTWEFSATGNLAENTLSRLGIQSDVLGIDLFVAVIGIAAFAWFVMRRGLNSGTALAAYILAGQVAGIIVGMRVDFYRYHLPIVLAVAILAGVAVQFVWAIVVSRVTHDQRSVSSSTGQPIQTGSR
ncbi:MAG: phospholipid carrier-dependent glycosyltransferase [Chloroflexota bacterium]|nr:phospholipid carrier-dependent glycosyltransferase [Chloroflexota bacterium]